MIVRRLNESVEIILPVEIIQNYTIYHGHYIAYVAY